jgi:hypothetical protein
MKVGRNVAVWLAFTSALPLLSLAQQNDAPVPSSPTAAQTQAADSNTNKQNSSAKPPSNASAQQADKDNKDKKDSIQEVGEGKVAGTSNDRLFYALPNFLTLQGTQKVPPLSTKDKFKVVALSTFDYFEYPWWGGLAAIDQAENNEPGYGQGWVAYAKRYGSTAADSMIENFMVGAVFASALHQDPRFYQSGKGGFWKRTGYAVTRIVVTRNDSAKRQFNYSEVFGSATAAAVSVYSYHPRSTFLSTPINPHLYVPSDRTLSHVASTWSTQLTLDSITIMLKEFWPDIHKKMSRKEKSAPEGSH